MKKKFLSFALALCFAIPCMFFLASCGGSRPNPNCYMTFEDVGETHVYFDYNTNVARKGEDFTFGVSVGEGYDATKIVVSVDEEVVPLSEGQWKIQDRQTYEWVDMTTTPKFPYGRKWIYTIENVQKDMTISVDTTQMEVGKIEASVSSAGSQSKFYVLKQDRNTIANTEEKIYSASFLGDQDIFEELEITDGKISFDYGKDLFIKIPEDLVEAFTLKLGEYEITNSFLQESDWVTYRREEEAGKKYVFVEIDYYYFAYSQTIASTPIEPVVENQNLVAVVFDDNPNFSFDYYKLCSSEDPDAILIDGDYFKEDSSPTYYEVDGESKRAVFAYVGEAENIEDDPYYRPYTNYDYASKKIAFEISKSNGQTKEELIQNLQFALTPYESQNEGYIFKKFDTGYGFFVVIELPQGYDSAKYLNFVTTIKESYLSEKYVDLDLTIQGAYGTDPIKVLSTSAEILYQDGTYYFEKDAILTKHFSQPKVKFGEFSHTTAGDVNLSGEDLSECLLQAFNFSLEEVAKYFNSYSSSETCLHVLDGVDVDEIWSECGEDSTTDASCCSTFVVEDDLEGLYLVAGYKYNYQTDSPDVKFIWLSKQTVDEMDLEAYTYQNYYYDYDSKTWHEKVGSTWKEVINEKLEVCERPNQLDTLPEVTSAYEAVDVDSTLFDAIKLFDPNADEETYKVSNNYDKGLMWNVLIRAKDEIEGNESQSPKAFAIVDVFGTDYYYVYSESVWKTERTLQADEVLESPELVELRDSAYAEHIFSGKTWLLGNVLKNVKTENFIETELTTGLLQILRASIPSASAEDFKAYEISFEDERFSNVVLIVELGEEDCETAKLIVFDFNAYDLEEPEGNDIIHLVFDIKENNNFNMRELLSVEHVFVGMDGLFSSGLYYDEDEGQLFRLSSDDGYGFIETPIFSATDLGNGFISVVSNNSTYFGTLIEEVEDGYVYMFGGSQSGNLYFKTTNTLAGRDFNNAYNFDMAYHYYDFEEKELSYPLFVFNSDTKVINFTQGSADFYLNYNFVADNAVFTINGTEKESQLLLDYPEFVSNFSDYQIAGDPQEDFKFIENAKIIFEFYSQTRDDVTDANYIIEEKNAKFDTLYDTEIDDHVKLMYLKVRDSMVFVTIIESENNGYLLYDQCEEKWYSIEFQRGVPSVLRLLTENEIPEYDISLQVLENISSSEESYLSTLPVISAQPYPGQIMKLLAAQLGLEAENIKYYPEANILEYLRYDYSLDEEVREYLVYLTADKINIANLYGYWGCYKVLYDSQEIPRLLKRIEDKSRELVDFGVFDIENDDITLSYTGIRSLKSLPHKLIFDSLLESGEVYIANDTTKTFDQYVLSDTSLFTHIDKDETHFEEVNSADEVYPETKVIFYSQARDIYVTDGTMDDVYDYDTYEVIGQRPAQVYSVQLEHVRDIFGYNISVEKDGKTFYLYVLNHNSSTGDDKDWTLIERQQESN